MSHGISTAGTRRVAFSRLLGWLLAAVMLAPASLYAAGPGNPRYEVVKVDVALNAHQFVFDEPLHENGLPAYGATFIIQGYMYEAGVLDRGPGINEDGTPQFPDEVIGSWFCRGWFIGEGFMTATGPWVVSTQVFNFGGKAGPKSIVTDGFEIVDLGEIVERAIVGGTGIYSTARGHQEQEVLGFNPTMAPNSRITLKILK